MEEAKARKYLMPVGRPNRHNFIFVPMVFSSGASGRGRRRRTGGPGQR